MKNIYDGLLSFKGEWRNYQQRVLRESDAYMDDGRIHITAAPGAGKNGAGDRTDPPDGKALSHSVPADRDTPAVAGTYPGFFFYGEGKDMGGKTKNRRLFLRISGIRD